MIWEYFLFGGQTTRVHFLAPPLTIWVNLGRSCSPELPGNAILREMGVVTERLRGLL